MELKCYIESFYIITVINKNKVNNTLTVPCGKTKIVSSPLSVIKSIAVSPASSSFPVKLICYIAVGWESSACYLLKSVAIIL